MRVLGDNNNPIGVQAHLKSLYHALGADQILYGLELWCTTTIYTGTRRSGPYLLDIPPSDPGQINHQLLSRLWTPTRCRTSHHLKPALDIDAFRPSFHSIFTGTNTPSWEA